MSNVKKIGVISIEDFEKAVGVFGFESPVVIALWNTMAQNPENNGEYETVYYRWSRGKYDPDKMWFLEYGFLTYLEIEDYYKGDWEYVQTCQGADDKVYDIVRSESGHDWRYTTI